MDLERALLERLGGEDVVFSPLGLRRALEVVRRGARGRTLAALDKVLGPDAPPDVAVDDLQLIDGGTNILAATHGRGLWQMPTP